MAVNDLFLLPSKTKFVAQYATNESTRAQAEQLYNSINSSGLVFLLGAFVVALLFAFLYYYPFNNHPGRHYKLRYWGGFMVMSAIMCGLVVSGMIWAFVDTPLQGLGSLYTRIIGVCIVWCLLFYIVSSIIYQQGKTNAYVWLKKKA